LRRANATRDTERGLALERRDEGDPREVIHLVHLGEVPERRIAEARDRAEESSITRAIRELPESFDEAVLVVGADRTEADTRSVAEALLTDRIGFDRHTASSRRSYETRG